MRYVPPFSSLNKNLIFGTEQGKPWVKMTYEDFENLLRQLLQAVKVDEEWYRSHYPDVDQAIQDGTMQSAHDHFVTSGYFEGRLPCEIEVNEECYLAAHPDIAEAVKDGKITSARQHFIEFGYAEGRRPAPSNQDV